VHRAAPYRSVPVTSTLDLMTAESRRPLLLWIAAAFWALSGCLGLLPLMTSWDALAGLAGPALIFVAAAVLTHVLSLVGAGLLVLRRRLALLPLASVFAITIVTLWIASRSLANMSVAFWLEWGFAAATVAHAALLAKRGVLR